MSRTKSTAMFDTKQLFFEVISRYLMKKNPLQVSAAYRRYENEHQLRELSGEPISQSTFYRWWDKYVSQEDKIRAQRGKKAAREHTRAKLGRTQYQGFHGSAQLDAFHEPIKLRSSYDFRPLKKSPVHHYVVESESKVMMGFSSNYETGSERVEHSIDSLKMAILPKTNVQQMWGTTHAWPVYGKTFEVTIDAGSAYNNTDFDTFLSMVFMASKVTRSRTPYEKELIEAMNNNIKQGFTATLDGSYDDDPEKRSEQEKIIPVFTELEHAVLHHRYIVDVFNQQVNNNAYHGLSRIDHWRREAQHQPPVLPMNPRQVIEFLGTEQRKTIMDKTGIQITVLGKKYIYNSSRLQELGHRLRKAFKDPVKRRVSLRWSITQTDFIKVRDPGTNDVFQVERVSDDRGDSEIRRRFSFDLDPVFYETQDIDVLSTMSTDEIKAHARQRLRAIEQSQREARRNHAQMAIALDLAAARDEERFLNVTMGVDTAQRHPNNGVEDPDISRSSGFSPGHAEELDWGSAVSGDEQ